MKCQLEVAKPQRAPILIKLMCYYHSMASPINSADDLTNDEVSLLVRSACAIIADDHSDKEENDRINETRIAIVLGRTSVIADLAKFQEDLAARYVKIMMENIR